MNNLIDGPFQMPGGNARPRRKASLYPAQGSVGDAFGGLINQAPPQVGAGSVEASMGGPQAFGEGMVQATPEMMQATQIPETFEAVGDVAGGMSGMQKAAIASQVGGGINDMIMRMQTHAPAARPSHMNFGRKGPTVSEQFRRGGGR